MKQNTAKVYYPENMTHNTFNFIEDISDNIQEFLKEKNLF
jgi:hypothetical protein